MRPISVLIWLTPAPAFAAVTVVVDWGRETTVRYRIANSRAILQRLRKIVGKLGIRCGGGETLHVSPGGTAGDHPDRAVSTTRRRRRELTEHDGVGGSAG